MNPLNDGLWQGRLIGYVDYMNASVPSSASGVAKVEGHHLDYFIAFNVKTGINRNLEQKIKYTVHSVGTPGGESSLVAKLGAEESFGIANFESGPLNALIQVEHINMSTNLLVAIVSVNLMCTSDSDCDDGYDTCNISAGICNHAPNALCSMRTELLTD